MYNLLRWLNVLTKLATMLAVLATIICVVSLDWLLALAGIGFTVAFWLANRSVLNYLDM